MELKKDFVPYLESLELKNLGFNEPCLAHFTKDKKFFMFEMLSNTRNSDIPEKYKRVSVPTFSQAFKWFRNKGYDIKVQKESDGLYFGFYWTGAAWIITGTGTYEEAELLCLKKLIETVKNK